MITSIGSSAGTYTTALTHAQGTRARPTETSEQKAFARLDENHDGGIDAAELDGFLSTQRSTSAALSTDSSDLLASLDTDADDSISANELAQGGQALLDALRSQLAEKDGAEATLPHPPKSDDVFKQAPATADADSSTSSTIALLLDQYRNVASGGPVSALLAVSA